MHAEQSACQTRRMIFVASFEWVRASKITARLPITCANCQEKPITAVAIKKLKNYMSVFSLCDGE